MTIARNSLAPGTEPVVVATAIVNGLGSSPHQVWAMRRAEQTALAESPFVLPDGTRATMGIVRSLPPRSHGEARMAAMTARMLDDVLPVIGDLAASGARIGLWLCLPERWKVGEAETLRACRRAWEIVSPVAGSIDVRAVCEGHASCARAMNEARAALASPRLDAAVVLAVDSHHDPAAMAQMLEQERVFDGENMDGAVPGEGGALLILARSDVAHRAGRRAWATVAASAVAEEMACFGSEMPCMGRGLTEAAHAATARLRSEGRRLDMWLTDVTGEEHRQHEISLTVPRIADGLASAGLRAQSIHTHLGDLGAASMATAMVIAIEGFRREGTAGVDCLITGASIGRWRGAVLLVA